MQKVSGSRATSVGNHVQATRCATVGAFEVQP